MANIKSAKKRVQVSEKKAAKNKSIRSGVKTAIKKVETAVASNDKDAAAEALRAATSKIDTACSKGVDHKTNESRKVARLAKMVNEMA